MLIEYVSEALTANICVTLGLKILYVGVAVTHDVDIYRIVQKQKLELIK